MKKIRWLLAALMFSLSCSCASLPVKEVKAQGIALYVDEFFLGQLVFLDYKMTHEFIGCVYGKREGNAVVLQLVVTASSDPRKSDNDSIGAGWACPGIHRIGGAVTFWNVQQLGIVHNHEYGSCLPSDTDLDSMRKDLSFPISFIVCGQGRTLSLYDEHGFLHAVSIPSLDSLYGVIEDEQTH